MLNWNMGLTVKVTVKYIIVSEFCFIFFIIDIGNESQGNIDTNLLFYSSDGKYGTRGGNGVNSSADKWISTIDMSVNPLINK